MNEAPKKPPTTNETPSDKTPKTIPVKSLTFLKAHPNFGARESIQAETAVPKGRVVIDFVPSLRHHRVELHAPDKPPRVVFIHEAHVSGWEPL